MRAALCAAICVGVAWMHVRVCVCMLVWGLTVCLPFRLSFRGPLLQFPHGLYGFTQFGALALPHPFLSLLDRYRYVAPPPRPPLSTIKPVETVRVVISHYISTWTNWSGKANEGGFVSIGGKWFM